MADKIVFDYEKMNSAVTAIKNLANQYTTASNTLQSALNAATDGWEGSSKASFMQFVNGPVKNFMDTSVPEMVNGIATLLDNNATAMQNADAQVANNMPTKL